MNPFDGQMNEFQQTLWDDLMTLVNESEAFYYADQQGVDGSWYRIFNYRLASYTEFLKPNALECRGHTFRISEEGENATPLNLVSLPLEKFFNLYENPMTMDLDLSTVAYSWAKLDGSLISTYIDSNGELRLKTKGSLSSTQALDAMAWLDGQEWFKKILFGYADAGYTINMEWTAPNNRIVIGYDKPQLRVLNGRCHHSGRYIHASMIRHVFEDYAVPFDCPWNPEEFIAAIPDEQGIEGFVVELESGQKVKIKTSWYLALHHTKDNINSPRRLFEAVLEEATDDMKMLFHDDALALKTIEEMETFVAEKYNHMVDSVERFYERNKHMERKEYAILGQQEFAGTFYFGLAMNKYTGKEFSYKDFLKSKWKQLGLKDLETDDESVD